MDRPQAHPGVTRTYTVRLSNSFDAESPEDAVAQMVAYALDNAGQAGYRVEWDGDFARDAEGNLILPRGQGSVFIDAEKIDPS